MEYIGVLTPNYTYKFINDVFSTNNQIKSYLLVQQKSVSVYVSTFNYETSMVVSCLFLSFED